MNPDLSYSDIHRNILLKLKKRIFKAPDYETVTEGLTKLAKVLKDEECPEYAAIYLLEKAKFEKDIGNYEEEAATLCEAADLFFQYHDQLEKLNCYCISDYRDWGVLCLGKASKIYGRLGIIEREITTYCFIADTLKEYHCYLEAIVYYRLCLQLVRDDIIRILNIYEDIIYCSIKVRDFIQAYKYVLLANSTISDNLDKGLLKNLAIKRVLLECLIHPCQNNFKASNVGSKNLISRSFDHSLFEDKKELALNLESLMLACQRGSTNDVELVCERLLRLLSYADSELVRELQRSLQSLQ